MRSRGSSPDSAAASARILSYAGRRPQIHATAWIAPGAVVSGDVTIEEDANLWFGVVVRGDIESVHIGARTNVQDLSVIHVDSGGFPTWIGDDVTIGHAAKLHGCRIERGVLVGIGATLLDGAMIGEGALIAAGSLVPPGQKIPGGVLAMGSPAKVVRMLSDAERREILEGAGNYVRFSKVYQSGEE